MKKLVTVLFVFFLGFGQINSTANPFNMGSSINIEFIHLPVDFPSGLGGETGITNGVQYLGAVFDLGDDSQIGFTFANSTYNYSFDFGDIDESSLNNVQLFYKSFTDENNFYELGLILNAYGDIKDAFIQGSADISNVIMFYPEFYGVNLAYGIRDDFNETTTWSAVNALEIYIPKESDSFSDNRETEFNIRSLLAIEMFFDEISFSLNYKINMNVSGDVDDFNDRFANTFYPQIKYIVSDQFEISANYQIYTGELFENIENRIGLGFTAFFD